MFERNLDKSEKLSKVRASTRRPTKKIDGTILSRKEHCYCHIYEYLCLFTL